MLKHNANYHVQFFCSFGSKQYIGSMKKLIKVRRSILLRIMRIFSLCSAGILASCAMKYGVPEEETVPVNFSGSVMSSITNTDIPGIKVEITGVYDTYSTISDSAGAYFCIVPVNESTQNVPFRLSDIDGDTNGRFQAKDTVIQLNYSDILAAAKGNIEIKLDTID